MDFDLDIDHLLSPVKKQADPLPPLDDLFQVTNKKNLFNVEFEQTQTHTLKNNKIEKLLKQLEQDDFEVEQGRSRIFRGRIHGLEMDDDRICAYLDQENEGHDIEPIKSPIRSNKVKKPLKPVRNSNIIPILKPLKSSLKNTSLKDTVKDIPKDLKIDTKRVCKPKHRNLVVLTPCLVHKQAQTYLVDSSTGSLNDATQFGTELNASNCEGFPLPESEHEVVQIPTNDGEKGQKMAIIRAVPNIQGPNSTGDRTGFYNRKEYDSYLNPNGVEVVGQVYRERAVRFAEGDDIEW